MYCPKCHNTIDNHDIFCANCGYKLIKKHTFMGLIIGLISFFLVITFFFYKNNNTITYSKSITSSYNIQERKNKYLTVIEINNTYSNYKIDNIDDVYNLIKNDSNYQKDSCPSNIKEIEDKMINEFNITAVNLCEMDISLANELYNAIKKVFIMFPSVKGSITNITIGNMDSTKRGVIAYFQPLFPFAEGDGNIAYKMRIVLNARYFLNDSLLDESIKNASLSGHFPSNATRSSSVAHELGHYLSFYAMRKSNKLSESILFNNSNVNESYLLIDNFNKSDFSKKILDEAYNLYLDEVNKKIDFDTWRSEISKYAITKDDSGNYLYDETVAEAFHDVYLNDDKAALASKYIMRILSKYVEE